MAPRVLRVVAGKLSVSLAALFNVNRNQVSLVRRSRVPLCVCMCVVCVCVLGKRKGRSEIPEQLAHKIPCPLDRRTATDSKPMLQNLYAYLKCC
jgi:hypothetical protein